VASSVNSYDPFSKAVYVSRFLEISQFSDMILKLISSKPHFLYCFEELSTFISQSANSFGIYNSGCNAFLVTVTSAFHSFGIILLGLFLNKKGVSHQF
jgi:hypothetical protein